MANPAAGAVLTRRLAMAGCLGVLAGCAPGRDLPRLPAYIPGTYRLGPGDQVHVITFGEEQLTGNFRVDDQGRVALPLLGSVPAAGRTPAELEGAIATGLDSGDYLKNPHVTVEIVAYRPIFVLGEVNKPGEYPYQPGMTFLTGVAVAGGFTYRAVQDYASVVRTVNNTATEGLIVQSSFLAPGDVMKVLERRF